jgi:hypothetical protein
MILNQNQNRVIRYDFKSKSKSSKLILNHDLKSNDLKSSQHWILTTLLLNVASDSMGRCMGGCGEQSTFL